MLDALKPSSMEILLTLSKVNPDGEMYIYISVRVRSALV